MDAAAPSWVAVAAWGAGLLELALGAGMMTSAGGGAVRGVGAALVVFGIVALGWGAATLARGRVISPRAGVAGALLALALGAVALALDPARVGVAAWGAASALLIAAALGCGAELRRRRGEPAAPGSPRLSVLFVSAVLVAAIVAPALGATEAGRLARDHAGHGVVDVGHH